MSNNLDPKRVTMSDIAVRLGVSHVTVSLSLRNDPRISFTLREKVQKLARKMGYRRDPMLTALAHYRNNVTTHAIHAEIAWLNFWKRPKQLREFREFDLYWQGAFEAAEKSGYRLEEFIGYNDLSLSRLEKILLARNIRGILLPPHRAGHLPPDWRKFSWKKFNVVRFGYSVSFPPSDRVAGDAWNNGILAFESIQKLGYKRIGFVSGHIISSCFKAGFESKQLGLDPKQRVPVLVLPSFEDYSMDPAPLHSWLRKYRPDAIFTDISEMREMLRQCGYRVPQDLGLATISVLDGNANAGLYQNSKDMGKMAVELLISMFHHHHQGMANIRREVLIAGRWVQGSTLPRRLSGYQQR